MLLRWRVRPRGPTRIVHFGKAFATPDTSDACGAETKTASGGHDCWATSDIVLRSSPARPVVAKPTATRTGRGCGSCAWSEPGPGTTAIPAAILRLCLLRKRTLEDGFQ